MSMEIEAKFLIPDARVLADLRELRQLGHWHFQPGKMTRVEDRYQDTADRALFRAHFACRVRNIDKRWQVTIKGFGAAVKGVHTREEYEFPLGGDVPTGAWPASAQALVQRYAGSASLHPLFTLHQTRQPFRVIDEDVAFAELTLDETSLTTSSGAEERILVVEVELLESNHAVRLQPLLTALRKRYPLQPTNESKFHWALRKL
ncbi:MAG: CYTH domain-containing protein [Armatimonadota bacterium]